MKTIYRILTFFILLSLVAACGTFEVSLDHAPDPNIAAASTVESLQQQNAALATAVATLDPVTQPLSLDSPVDIVRNKIARSSTTWQTLYAEGNIFEGGSTAPTQHVQAWIDQLNAQGRTLGGTPASPQWMMIANGQKVARYDLRSGQSENYGDVSPEAVKNLETLVGGASTPTSHPLVNLLGSTFGDMIFPLGTAQATGSFQIVEMGKTELDRPALIVDYFPAIDSPRSERLWVDVQTGMILRLDSYEKGSDGKTVAASYVITRLDFNVPVDATQFVLPPQSLPLKYVATEGDPQNALGTATPTTADDALGQVYFFYQESDADLQIARLPGSCVAGLTECPQLEVFPSPAKIYPGALVWSPDRKLAALVYYANQDGTKTALSILNPETLAWTQIAEFFAIDPPLWSADSNWLAFRVQDGQGGEDLYVAHPDGSGLQSVSSKLPEQGRPYVMNGWIGFNLLVNTGKPGNAANYYRVQIPDGTVTTLFKGLSIKSLFTPSADGSLLAYVDYDYKSPKHTIKVLTPNGDTQRELASFNDLSIYPLVWSPDGNYIAFIATATQLGGGSSLYLIRRDGRDLQLVYQSAQVLVNPAFSPDGKYLVVEESSRIYAIDLETLESHIINAPGLSLIANWQGVSWR